MVVLFQRNYDDLEIFSSIILGRKYRVMGTSYDPNNYLSTKQATTCSI